METLILIKELLHSCNNGITNSADVIELKAFMNRAKQNKVLEIHKQKINRRETQKLYITNIKVDNHWKQISCKSYEGMIEKLYKFYFEDNTLISFNKLFNERQLYKKNDLKRNNATLRREVQRYNKFIKCSLLHDKDISKITSEDLERLLNNLITEKNLTAKEFSQLRALLKSTFKYAIKKKYLDENVMDYCEFNIINCRVVEKGKKDVVDNSEYDKVISLLNKDSSLESYAILLAVYTGLRIGELTALKWDSVKKNSIYVHRSECKQEIMNEDLTFEKTTYGVENRVKRNDNSGYRDVLLSNLSKNVLILAKKHQNGEYVFHRSGVRLTSRQVTYHLEKVCKKAEIQNHTPHDLRRTFASRCYDNGMKITQLQSLLGHSSLRTTEGYIRNIHSDDEALSILNIAMNC